MSTRIFGVKYLGPLFLKYISKSSFGLLLTNDANLGKLNTKSGFG